jgi:ABC-type multidrug transport system ATPase subunit
LKPGDLCAVIGASGAGKSTFLDVIAGRKSSMQMSGNVYVNGRSDAKIKQVSKYCTQEDALFGSLTVLETLKYAAEFNLPQSTSKKEKERIVDELMVEFGLKDVENTIIGTPLIKGCSGGQVRRVSVASQLIGMNGGLLFLDEPTSGLDSVAAFSVVEAVKRLAENKKCTVMATIHQPSTETFEMFTHLLIIAKGQTVYFGERDAAIQHFADLGHPIPNHANPSDVYLRLTNTDFLEDKVSGNERVLELVQGFKNSPKAQEIQSEIDASKKLKDQVEAQYGYTNSFLHQTATLISRAFVNAAKNPLSYWVRVAMYTALAVLMGTTWLRLGADQQDAVNRIVAIYFSVAFLSFMAVAGIPAFLEERHVFLREK